MIPKLNAGRPSLCAAPPLAEPERAKLKTDLENGLQGPLESFPNYNMLIFSFKKNDEAGVVNEE